MKESFSDVVVDRLHERMQKVNQKLTNQYSKTKPFRMEPVSDEQHLYIYNNMNEQDLNYAIQTYGREPVNQWLFEMNQKIQKKVQNG